MEKTIVDNKNRDVSVGITYHLDSWALLSISWWKYNHVDTIFLSAEEVPEQLGVTYNPRILGGARHIVTGKCFNINIDFLCFRFFIESWRWLA